LPLTGVLRLQLTLSFAKTTDFISIGVVAVHVK
jgi:hypothetical protein